MMVVQACRQHRLVVMQPNKAKSFLAATVSWYSAATVNVGPEARRVGMLRDHTRVSKSTDDGEVEACWEYCAQHVGRTKART